MLSILYKIFEKYILKMNKRILIGAAITLIIVTSCTADETDLNTNNDVNVPNVIPNGNENYLTMDSDYIFDQNSLNTFELKIPQSQLELIDSDPSAEEYIEGMLIFQGDTISPVGIRYKGSIGAFVGCLSGINVFDPS